MSETRPNTWMVRAGRGSYVFEEFEKKGCVAIGWKEMGDISGIKTRDDLARRHDEAYPDLAGAPRGVQIGRMARFTGVSGPLLSSRMAGFLSAGSSPLRTV